MPEPGDPSTIDCTQRLLPLLEELRAGDVPENGEWLARVADVIRPRRRERPEVAAPRLRALTRLLVDQPGFRGSVQRAPGSPALHSHASHPVCGPRIADPRGLHGRPVAPLAGQSAAARDRQLFPARRRRRSIRREDRPRLARGDPARRLERPASRDRRRRPVVRAGPAPVQARTAGSVASRGRAPRRTRLGRRASAVPAGAGTARIAFPRPGGGSARSHPPSRRRPGRRGRRAPPRRAARPVRRLHRVDSPSFARGGRRRFAGRAAGADGAADRKDANTARPGDAQGRRAAGFARRTPRPVARFLPAARPPGEPPQQRPRPALRDHGTACAPRHGAGEPLGRALHHRVAERVRRDVPRSGGRRVHHRRTGAGEAGDREASPAAALGRRGFQPELRPRVRADPRAAHDHRHEAAGDDGGNARGIARRARRPRHAARRARRSSRPR